jgi:hypothetical protein
MAAGGARPIRCVSKHSQRVKHMHLAGSATPLPRAHRRPCASACSLSCCAATLSPALALAPPPARRAPPPPSGACAARNATDHTAMTDIHDKHAQCRPCQRRPGVEHGPHFAGAVPALGQAHAAGRCRPGRRGSPPSHHPGSGATHPLVTLLVTLLARALAAAALGPLRPLGQPLVVQDLAQRMEQLRARTRPRRVRCGTLSSPLPSRARTGTAADKPSPPGPHTRAPTTTQNTRGPASGHNLGP